MISIPRPLRVHMDDEPILRTVSSPLLDEHFGNELNRLLDAMVEVVRKFDARGLAAVQIGVPVRVLIAVTEDRKVHEFINPEVTRTLNRFVVEREGCLSVPTYKWGNVSRPAKCDVTWFDRDRAGHSATLTGELARIFQHELDHLNGVLLTDKRV